MPTFPSRLMLSELLSNNTSSLSATTCQTVCKALGLRRGKQRSQLLTHLTITYIQFLSSAVPALNHTETEQNPEWPHKYKGPSMSSALCP